MLQKRITLSFATVTSLLEERRVLLEKMIHYIEKNLSHEEVLIKKITKHVEEIKQVKKINDSLLLVKAGEKLLNELEGLDQVYGNLKNNQEYQEWKDESKRNQERMQYAFISYDEMVKNYNVYRENPFLFRFSKICRFPDYRYYNE